MSVGNGLKKMRRALKVEPSSTGRIDSDVSDRRFKWSSGNWFFDRGGFGKGILDAFKEV